MKFVLILVLVGMGLCTITKDMDIKHGHTPEYFDHLKDQQSEKVLQVHIMPHTHDDVGWLKTYDQYFSGERDDIQLAGVQYIIDGIYDQLMKDANKKFTYVEIAYFALWWEEQDQDTRDNVKQLVQEGRLEFVNGGWSMSDEANVYYEDFINNMKAGHDFLRTELDYKPTIGWHIDPFGHQSATAALFAEMGFDAWFFARADYQDKEKRLDEKSLEFLWRPLYNNLGNRTEIYTQLLYQHYHAPQGFCFSERCSDEPIVDDPELESYNVEERTAELYDYLIHMAEHFRTNHLLVPFGQDFAYLNAQKSFKNVDKLIKHMNKRYPDMNLFYSTPYEYIKSVHETGVKLPTKYDDMLPYADQPHAYWSGYFTSRANFKGFVKETSGDFNTGSMIYALEAARSKAGSAFDKLMASYNTISHEMGVSQHHDAVAGTAKQAVMDNYSKRLAKALDIHKKQLNETFNAHRSEAIDFEFCLAHNSTAKDCPTQKFLEDPSLKEMTVKFANVQPLQAPSIQTVPLPNARFDVSSARVQHCDIFCEGEVNCRAFLPFQSLGLLSENEFTISASPSKNDVGLSDPHTKVDTETLTFQYKGLNSDGQAEFELYHKKSNMSDVISLDLSYYTSFENTKEPVSGAYLFRTADEHQKPQLYNNITDVELKIGNNVSLFTMTGTEATVTLIISDIKDFITIETTLNGLPLTQHGMEVVLRIQSQNIKNGGVFFTDSMGMEMQQRMVDYRPSWELNVTEPISGNFYPINSAISIQDCQRTLEVLTDRAQGGSSLNDGQIEIMLQRRLYVDDSRGLNEALNETDSTSQSGRGPMLKTIHDFRMKGVNSEDTQSNIEGYNLLQVAAASMAAPPLTIYVEKIDDNTFLDISLFSDKLNRALGPESEFLKIVAFPEAPGQIFVRVENVLDTFTYSKTIELNATDFAEVFAFCSFEPKSITEVSMSGLFTMDEMQQRLKWNGEDFTSDRTDYSTDLDHIKLLPQQIRSFRITYEEKPSNIAEKLKEFIE